MTFGTRCISFIEDDRLRLQNRHLVDIVQGVTSTPVWILLVERSNRSGSTIS